MRHEISQGLAQELVFTAVRSRGPGGQNVNKVSSAALALWDFESSTLINFHEKYLVRTRLASFVNKEGQLYVRSDEYRDLPQNKARCAEKILEYLARAFHKDKPRKPSKPTRASRVRTKEAKSRRSDVKKGRQKNWKGD